jgi:hypothetical protein
MLELSDYFRKLRFDKDHHLGLGDIRLTMHQQDEICELISNRFLEILEKNTYCQCDIKYWSIYRHNCDKCGKEIKHK